MKKQLLIVSKKFFQTSLWILLMVCSQNVLLAEPPPYIFDWNIYYDTTIDGVTPVPNTRPATEGQGEALYDSQDANGGLIGLLLDVPTGPDHGTYPGVLDDTMDYINANGYALHFVFSDFEPIPSESYTQTMADDDSAEMVYQIRNYANSAINTAYIGNYWDYPGATDYSNLWASYDRTARHNFYVNSGMNIAMPVLYPDSAYRNHNTRSDLFGSNRCVSIAHALFWTPLEMLSTAKNALPSGHLLIPWVGGFILTTGYDAPVPSKTECRSLLQHVRLRGASGYYTWSNGANTNYVDRPDYRDDMYANAWKPLDWFFKYPGKSEILNLTTNKTGGVEWSGMRRGNHCLFIISNYTGSSVQVNYPNTIENIPDYSPSVAAGAHQIFDYAVGPKSYWKLDENTGTGTADTMAAGYSGTISSATWATGKLGNALAFNGSNASVSFGDVLDMGTRDRSISLWVKTTSSVSPGVILSKGYSYSTNEHSIYLYDGKIECLMNINGTCRYTSTGVTVNDGQWHHIAVTIQRNDKMKIYLDGIFKNSVDISADASVDAQNAYNFYLGRAYSGQYFTGSIDEVKIFSGALSEREVFDEYAACSLSTRLDEQQGTMAYDDNIIAHNGTVSGATLTAGKLGNALTFDGSNDEVSFGDVLDMGTSDRSISFWVKTTSSVSPGVILSKGYSYSTNEHSIYLYDGKIECLMNINGTCRYTNTGVTVNDGQWHHIAVTIQRSGSMKIYLDGTYKNSVDISADASVNTQNDFNFYLGRAQSGQYFTGSIDEVKVYNKALTSDDIGRLYNSYQ